MKAQAWTDVRDGKGVERRVVLCPQCVELWRACAKRKKHPVYRRSLRVYPLPVLAGECELCAGVFCACRGEIPCANCPAKGKQRVDRVRAYFVEVAS